MRHDPASAAIVIMLRELKMHGTENLPTLCGDDSHTYIPFQFFHQ